MIGKRRCGRTGHRNTATVSGAAALRNVTQGEAARALNTVALSAITPLPAA